MDGKLAVLVVLVVVSEPYTGIDYNRINSYDVSQEYLEDVIHVHESEGYSDSYQEDYEEEQEEKPRRDDTEVFIPWLEIFR